MTWTRRDLLIGASGAAVAACLPAAASAGMRVIEGPAFGTYWRMGLPTDADAKAARAAIEAIVTTVDESLSPFRAASEVSRFNRLSSTGWFLLSPHAAAVAAEGLRIATLTGGAFDPTVGGIVGRFGFGPIHSATPATFADLSVRDDALRKSKPGVTFDPCGIGKGYALDLMAVALGNLGIRAFMIELGGEVVSRGNHPDGRPWQIGIERPGETPLAFQRILRLDGEVLATSGDSINGYDLGGRRLSHIVDPRTSRPAENNVASVSVVAPTGATADALATALFAMGADRGPDFARKQGLPALFLIRSGNDLTEVKTPDLDPYIMV